MNIIHTQKAPAAIGPYSQGYAVNGLVFTSGQIPVDPATGAIPEGIAAQCEQSCKNVAAILEAAGVSMDKVFKPPASWLTWTTLPPSMQSMPSILSPSPPEAAWQ